jgi:hypothetical protein
LVEGRITIGIFSAGGDLFRVNYIHRVAETIVGQTYGTANIPQAGIVFWFIAT